jgi:tyrosyl-tRNA synthetase
LDQAHIIQQLIRGVDEIIPQDDFLAALAGNQSLTVKLGFDPTAPDLHLGHSVVLNKLRLLQQLGHRIVFIVGDFTASIGDPTGRSKTRPALSPAEIKAHAETYAMQVFKLLDPRKTEIRYNGEWLGQMTARDLIGLAAGQSVARMLERDDFAKRFAANTPISIHEFLYPLLQGYDSVAINADVELGGRDQKFNLLMGRTLQKQVGQSPQAVFMMPLLEGTDGVQKMSKSLGNTIDIASSPDEMFGKILSISDTLMWRYYDLLSSRTDEEIAALRQAVAEGGNPRDTKILLAKEIVARFHDEASADVAADNFHARFSKGQLPSDIPEVAIVSAELSLPISYVLKQAGLVKSSSEGLRMLQQGGVRLDQQPVQENVALPVNGEKVLLQVGKRKIAWVQLSTEG